MNLTLFDSTGKHNSDPASIARLERVGQYRDLSVVVIIPTLGTVPAKVVGSWLGLMNPPNNRLVRIFAEGMEVGAAYSQAIEQILAHPELGKYKYILTLEHDNTPPADGLVKILESAENHPEFSTISGLYWTKGESGVPQIWGDPNDHPLNFRPQIPKPGELVECCGTGMGFTLFRLAMFRDERLRKPWFKTTASPTDGAYTQDLYFHTDARKHGYRSAVDCSILVGHYDSTTGVNW